MTQSRNATLPPASLERAEVTGWMPRMELCKDEPAPDIIVTGADSSSTYIYCFRSVNVAIRNRPQPKHKSNNASDSRSTIADLRKQVRHLKSRIAELEKMVSDAAQMETDFLAAMHSISPENHSSIPDELWDWEATLEERANGTPPISASPQAANGTGLPAGEALDELHRMLADGG